MDINKQHPKSHQQENDNQHPGKHFDSKMKQNQLSSQNSNQFAKAVSMQNLPHVPSIS